MKIKSTLLWLAALLCSSVSAVIPEIIIPEKPLPTEQTAQKELQNYLSKLFPGDKKLFIEGKEIKKILLGSTARKFIHDTDFKNIAEEEYIIKNSGNNLLITGGGRRGTLYGAYSFLENQLGIVWLTAQVEHVPAAKTVNLPALNIRQRPFLTQQRAMYRHGDYDTKFLARNRTNSSGGYIIGKELGGEYSFGRPNAVHTFDHYFPANKYLESHPHYFSLINGKRYAGQLSGQLCLTNPELQEAFLAKLLEYIKQDQASAKASGMPMPQVYDISQNDNWNYCQCPTCKEDEKKYGQSGIMIRFVNKMAREASKIYPDLLFSTLAYFYTEPLPKGGVKPEHNVIVRLCDTNSNQALGIYAPDSKTYHDTVKGWGKICDNLHIWFYAINYVDTGLPFPSEFTHGETFRFYADNNVKGFFIEHERPQLADFYPLKLFLELKLMENPYADTDKLIKKFCDLYYKKASEHIINARKILYDAAKRNKGFVNSSGHPDQYKYIKVNDMLAMQKEFDAAAAAVAGNRELEERVFMVRKSIDQLAVRFAKEYTHEFNKNNPGKAFPLKMSDIVARYEKYWEKACRIFTLQDTIKETIKKELSMARNTDFTAYVPPKKFNGKRYIDFTMDKCKVSVGNGLDYAKDPESDNGQVIKLTLKDSPQRYYDLPFAVGVYNSPRNQMIHSHNIYEAEKDGKYHWYYCGRAKNPSGMVYVSRSWGVSAHLTSQLDQTRTLPDFDIWVKLKFIGPNFSGKGKTDEIYIDRITLVDARENTAPKEFSVSAQASARKVFAYFDGTMHKTFPADKWSVSSRIPNLKKTSDFIVPGNTVVKAALNAPNADKFKLPFGIGVYDPATKKIMVNTNISKIFKDEKYHWYKVGNVTNPKGYVYLTNTWGVQAYFNVPAGSYELWACLKFEGKDFVSNSKKASSISMAQIVFKEK